MSAAEGEIPSFPSSAREAGTRLAGEKHCRQVAVASSLQGFLTFLLYLLVDLIRCPSNRARNPGEQGHVSQETFLGIHEHENGSGVRRFTEPSRGKEFKTSQS